MIECFHGQVVLALTPNKTFIHGERYKREFGLHQSWKDFRDILDFTLSICWRKHTTSSDDKIRARFKKQNVIIIFYLNIEWNQKKFKYFVILIYLFII